MHSCQHLPSEMGYNKAKILLAEHFGNEYKTASAYMENILNWTPAQVRMLKNYSHFSLLYGFKTLSESTVDKLDPVLDDGMLGVSGRLNNAALTAEFKHAVILSKDMLVSTFILHHIHNQLGHAGRNHMLSR